MIYLLSNIFDIVTHACMLYFRQSNCVKQVPALEMVGITCIFPEPDFALVLSIVYIVLYYKVLFKKMKSWAQLQQMFVKYEWSKKKNQIIYNNSLLPELPYNEVFLVLFLL